MSQSGILLLDKPLGLSSSAATQRVRRLFDRIKAGHVGSLDPLATGMLPICLGEATKLAGEILEGDKVYRFTIALGARTATGDTEGEVIEQAAVPDFSDEQLQTVLRGFLGESQQIPPMYSALKRDGQPLYKLARAGQTVERAPRSIRIVRLHGERRGAEVICEVQCGKGTYVRVLAEDIANALGTVGHVSALRREQVQPFPADRMVSLESLEAQRQAGMTPALLGPADVLPHLRSVHLESEMVGRLRHGQSVIGGEGPYALDETLLLWAQDGEFLGLGRGLGAMQIAPKRLVAAGASR